MRRTVTIAAGTLAALAAGAAPALAADAHASRTRHFSEVESGKLLSTSGLRFEDVLRVKSGPFGAGGVVRNGVLTGDSFPVTGKDTALSYFNDGRLSANETITMTAPHVDGIGTITGTGTCGGGTLVHPGETCTYTIRGTYDHITGEEGLTLSGTYTPSSSTKKK